MNTLLIAGIIVCAGFILGQCARRLGIPRVTGYLLAGILLNPEVIPLIPSTFPSHTDPVTNFALSFIAFSVGGTLKWSKLRQLGKTIMLITVLEAETACLLVIGGFALVLTLGGSVMGLAPAAILPLSLLLGAMASPTDPTATLAVAHEYKASGPVTSTVMGVAAFDDVFGLLNFSVAIVLAKAVMSDGSQSPLLPAIGNAGLEIFGGIAIGAVVGLILNLTIRLLRSEAETEITVIVFGLLAICFGLNRLLGLDELLGTMAMGAVVVNFNPRAKHIFSILERYTEQLVFVLFFTLSGMYLDFRALGGAMLLVALFVLLRGAGKAVGATLGARFSGAEPTVKRYVFLGLLPQGGIVIGLALVVRGNPAFDSIAPTLVAVVIGATVIHELIGPIVARIGLSRAGELHA